MNSTARSPVTRRYALLFGLVLVGIAGYWLWWQHVARTIEAKLTQMASAGSPGGRLASWTSLSREGFPYRLEIRLTGLKFQSPQGAGLAWAAPGGAVLHFMPFNLNHVIFHSEGPVTISDGAMPPLTLTSEMARASVVMADGVPERIAVDIVKAGLAGGRLPSPVNVAKLQLFARKTGEGAARQSEWAFRIEDLALAMSPAPMGGEPLKHLELGWVAPGGFAEGLAAGQMVKLTKGELAWGPLNIAATGNFGFDAAGLPAAKFDFETTGETAVVDDAMARFQMPPAQGDKIKQAIAAYKAANNRDGKLLVTVQIENSRLTVGGIDLGPMPAVPVPAPAPAP